MHSRRFSMLVAGLWFGITFAMLFVATQNFRGVERMLESPASEAAKALDKIGNPGARMFLRYQAAELNRFYFEWYSIAQIVLAVLLGTSLLFATNGNKLMLGLSFTAAAIVIFERTFLLPEINFLGRTIDFVPLDAPSPARARFGSFHFAYSICEIVKLAVLTGMTAKVVVKGPRTPRGSRNSGQEAPDDAVELRR